MSRRAAAPPHLGPQVFAVLNVTPDSFSDGGEYSTLERAIARGLELKQQGADIIDVGGESTRPGATRVSSARERERVIPVIRALVAEGVPVSVDTMNADTARAAARAGASVINDVSGGLADADMYRAVAETGLLYIAMHWRANRVDSPDRPGFTHDAESLAHYDDVVAEVRTELKARLAEMVVWGVDPDRVVLDPGLGFAKNAEQNWRLLAGLESLATLGHPLLVGASRKRFLSEVLPDGASTTDRDLPTAVISALAADAGVWGVRVHDVVSTRAALGVWTALKNGRTA